MSKKIVEDGHELYVTLRQTTDGIEVWVNGEVVDKEENSIILLLNGEKEGFAQSAQIGNIDMQAQSIANLLASYEPALIKQILEIMGMVVNIKEVDEDGLI